MKYGSILIPALALILFIPGPPAAADSSRPVRIVAGTALIEDIIRDLSGGRAEILTLIPGSSCPGHNDLKAGDLVFAAGADLVVVHSFQQSLPQVKNMMETVGRPELALTVVPVEGSWLVPAAQKEAVLAIAEALSRARPAEAESIGRRAGRRLAAVDRLEKEWLARLAPVKGRPVAVASVQAQFVRWAGLEPVAEYGRAEEMDSRQVAGLVRELRGRRPAAVIDNLQSGAEAGLPLALEIKVPHLFLSNFPGYSAEAPDYFSLMEINVGKLADLGGAQ